MVNGRYTYFVLLDGEKKVIENEGKTIGRLKQWKNGRLGGLLSQIAASIISTFQ